MHVYMCTYIYIHMYASVCGGAARGFVLHAGFRDPRPFQRLDTLLRLRLVEAGRCVSYSERALRALKLDTLRNLGASVLRGGTPVWALNHLLYEQSTKPSLFEAGMHVEPYLLAWQLIWAMFHCAGPVLMGCFERWRLCKGVSSQGKPYGTNA